MDTKTTTTKPETIAQRFARETAHHKLTVLHDDGLYRHLRFQKPGTSSYAFELITVPNAFIYRGEESYVFSRLRDMFEFFRGPAGHINPGYWSEKLTSDRDCVKKYDQALFEQLVRDHVAEAVEDDPALSGLTSAARGAILESDEIGAEDGARDTLTSFAFYKNPDDRWDVDKQPDFQFTDTWEWDLRDFGWWYLWACHAIVWGIARYDEAGKADAPADDRTAPGRRCGNCRFREVLGYRQRSYGKCVFPADLGADEIDVLGPPRVTHGAASDCRSWWPACADHTYGDRVSDDAARHVPEAAA